MQEMQRNLDVEAWEQGNNLTDRYQDTENLHTRESLGDL